MPRIVRGTFTLHKKRHPSTYRICDQAETIAKWSSEFQPHWHTYLGQIVVKGPETQPLGE